MCMNDILEAGRGALELVEHSPFHCGLFDIGTVLLRVLLPSWGVPRPFVAWLVEVWLTHKN